MIYLKKLEEVAEIIMGTSPAGDTYNYDGIGLPLLNGPTEFGNVYPESSLYTIDSKKECRPGDLIFCVRGNTTGRMNWADKRYSLGRGVCAIRGKNHIDTKYIRYCLEMYLPELLQLASGATMPNLKQSSIKQFPIPCPKSKVKIVSTLTAYDDLIENNLRRIKILEEMAQNLYREWFVNFCFPGNENARFVDSPLGKIPEGWEPVPVKDFLSKNIGGSWGKEEISGDYQSKVRVIRGTDFSRIKVGTFDTIPTRYIKPKELNNRMLEAGDLLIENSVNASSRCVGTPQIITQGILKRLEDPTICASFCKLYRPKTDKYTALLYLHMNYLLEENKMNFYQNVAANGIGNFQSQRFLQDEMIIVPSEVTELDILLSNIKPLLTSIYAEKIDILRQTRDLLLPKLISGEVDASELNIKVPEEVAI